MGSVADLSPGDLVADLSPDETPVDLTETESVADDVAVSEATSVPAQEVEDITGTQEASADEGTIGSIEDSPESVAEASARAAARASEEQAQAKSSGGSRAAERIRQLANANRELRQAVSQSQQQTQAQLAQLQQELRESRNLYNQAIQHQSQLMQRQMDLAEGRRAEEDVSKLPIDQQIEYKAAKKARAEVERLLEERLAGIEQDRAAERAANQQWKDELAREKRFAKLKQMSDKALSTQLLNDYEPEDAAKLRNEAEEMLLTYSGTFGLYPEQAAPKLKAFIDKAVEARMRANSKKKAVTLAKGAAVKTPQAKVSGAKRAMPSHAELRKQGITPIDWITQNLLRGVG